MSYQLSCIRVTALEQPADGAAAFGHLRPAAARRRRHRHRLHALGVVAGGLGRRRVQVGDVGRLHQQCRLVAAGVRRANHRRVTQVVHGAACERGRRRRRAGRLSAAAGRDGVGARGAAQLAGRRAPAPLPLDVDHPGLVERQQVRHWKQSGGVSEGGAASETGMSW